MSNTEHKCAACIDGEYRWLNCRAPTTPEQAYRLAARVGRVYHKSIVFIQIAADAAFWSDHPLIRDDPAQAGVKHRPQQEGKDAPTNCG